ncbi:unannotated protein [freshwater metagenome]|uniref:Unannotated protein n=1 Tax=freshwater metagenome TaxID=449393 RepID=A0A6J7HNL9_9ZZZZ|nr:hypothetical protein [Actinomycetota bacterium]
MTNYDFAAEQQAIAAAWKKRTPALWPAARQRAPWINQDGTSIGNYAHCLPAEHAEANLLPGNHAAIPLFRDLGIPWHCGIDDGPGNNLLSSQVQCVNALMPMVEDSQRIVRAFGRVVDIAEVLQIESGRYLTFEYIGPSDYFGEGAGKPRIRGTRCTSVDAAFLYRTSTGTTELALVEWKYTEKYTTLRTPNAGYDKTRIRRYGADYHDPSGPLRSDLMDIEWMLDEPFYQLMRQQLLAWRLERDGAEGANVVRVLHVLPPDNEAYQQSLVRAEHRQLGDSVDEVWAGLLRTPDRFQHVDPAVFLDESITSWDYVDRYSPSGTGDLPWGVSVWRDDERIVAAAYVYDQGFEWCHRRPHDEAPRDVGKLAAMPAREYFPLADDEKTIIVGPLEYARAFLRAAVATGLNEPDGLTSYSWPGRSTEIVSAWPPLNLEDRLSS